MVAAFWDDADFSKGVGTTWYQVRATRGVLGESSSQLTLILSFAICQEYSTLSSTQDPVVQDVEAKIEKYLKIPYVAKWTLKVTWEKAPAYPSRRDDTQVSGDTPGDREECWWLFQASVCSAGRAGQALGALRGCLVFLQTSTYQAVLSTDGSRSFALLLYQDGGMRWDYSRLAAANVLIGFSRCCTPLTAFWDSRELFQHRAQTVRGITPRRAQLPLLEQSCAI